MSLFGALLLGGLIGFFCSWPDEFSKYEKQRRRLLKDGK